ncbi:MAG: pyridoxal phosphate-dependent aminotransferase [Acidobacteria bacterium]|nr:pyridoxal phosphate-dependent aminotransferase [Acidobacteriota bacterium]
MLHLDPTPWHDVLRHTCACFPNEACGILLGPPPLGPNLHITEAVLAPNVHQGDQTKRYEIGTQLLFDTQRGARARGLHVLAYFHSHPNRSAYFSPTDLAHAHAHSTHLVLSLQNGAFQHAKAFRVDETQAREISLSYPEKMQAPEISAKVAATALAVPHSRIREIADIAMAMDGVLRLYFGESNLPTPAFIKDAAQKALADGFTYYTENAGLPSLRQAIAAKYAELHGVTIDPSREIVVTASGVQALQLGIRCALDPGDEAIVLTPAWQNQISIPAMCNAAVRLAPLTLSEGRYHIDFDLLDSLLTPRTRLLIYTSPSNPTGWVATPADQQALLVFARRHRLWLLADEVYERLYYPDSAPLGTPAPSILRLATREDSVFVVQSFSKAYCMTGWRVGWIVARADFADRATKLNEFIISSAPAFAQRAAETALRDGEPAVREMLALYKSNRDFSLEALRRRPDIQVPQPDGAGYLFPQVAGLQDSFEYCRRLLLETKLGLAPGIAFGPGGESAIRLCYAVERPILAQALSILTT